MKRLLNILLVLMLCLGMVACGKDTSDDKIINQDSNMDNAVDSTNEQDEADIISMEELYGTYVSTLDETISFIFTSDEYLVENNRVVSCPLYRQEQGKEKTTGGAYSFDIAGNVLTVVDYYGEKLYFEINVDKGQIILEFLEEQYGSSFFDAPYFYGILSDLVKQSN